MGVHGLTAFLKENRRALSHTLELGGDRTANDKGEDDFGIKLVVDGWSFIYAIFSYSGDSCIYGGECDALCKHVEAVVSSWISVGINPTFVFDGPYPPLKYQTVISRLQDNCVKPANLFFRTSPAARSTRRFLAETRFVTPLAYQCVVSTLLSMGSGVQVEIADKEADPYIVSLAAAQGAYVAGNDSDFLVLYCEGCKGYVPLEDMTWIASVKKENVHLSTPLAEGEDDGFQTITKKKQKGLSITPGVEYGNGLLPPTSPIYSDLTLLLTVYEHAVFAEYISLPPTLLPLLGSLIGNDYATFDFFRRGETAVERVKRVASTFASVLKDAQSGNIKKLRKIHSPGKNAVIDVIGTTVERLLTWRNPANSPESGHIGEITAKVVQSTLRYSLDDTASLLQWPLNKYPGDATEQISQLYLQAYRKGILHPRIMDVFTGGSCFPRLFLEDPDRECCARSIGRPIREILWSVLSNAGGIPERSSLSQDDIEDQEAAAEALTDEEELVDVVEEASDEEVSVANDDDPLAVLRGRLQRLSFSGVEEVEHNPDATNDSASECDAESQNSKGSGEEINPALSKSVTEYIRRGTRVVGEDVEVRPLHLFLPGDFLSDTPVQLMPLEQRLRFFLQVLGSNTNAIREFAAKESREIERSGILLAIVTLRWVLKTLHTRLEAASDSNIRRDRDQERWTRSDAQAFLASLDEDPAEQPPTIENRAVQLTAQLLAGFEACGWLAQALLLVDPPGVRKNVTEEPNLPFRLGEAERLFSGQRFHYALHRSRLGATMFLPPMWNAVEEGLEGTFREEKRKETKGRHDKKKGSDKVTIPPGMFGVLSLDIE